MTTAPSTGQAAAKKTAAPRTRPTGTTTSGAVPRSEARQTSLQQLLATVCEGDVLSVTELHAWLEAYRGLTSGLAFMAHAASSQLEAAVRKGARDSADGRLTMQQKIEQRHVLRRLGKDVEGSADDLLNAARSAVRAWGRMEAFLDGLESDNVARPHRKGGRGGFSLD